MRAQAVPTDSQLADEAALWLQPTRQLDLHDPKLRITAQKLTQARQTLTARAVAIHDFVRRLPYAASVDGATLPASEVLRRGRGDGMAKGVLFVALCRAAGLPARLLFADVQPSFLVGLVDQPPQVVPHAIGQVQVDGRWRSTDAYVVDPVLFAHAKWQLRAEGRIAGYGLLRDAQATWPGDADCLQQCRARELVTLHGVFDDPAAFQATRLPGAAECPFSSRLRATLAAHQINRRVAHLRTRVHVPAPGAAALPSFQPQLP
jgi:hypothetical protein